MYIPSHFKFKDQNQVIAFMQRYSFATLITSKDNLPVATHIPFCIEQRGDQLILSSHFAKANPQAIDLSNQTTMVIFTEPHAYISPGNYEKVENVPTWNYIAVHAYGFAAIVTEAAEQLNLLEKMIKLYDQAYLQQWAKLSIDYKLKMIKGIVAFEITVTDLQAQQKLSQNKKAHEREKIIDSLKNSPHSTEQELATYMNIASSSSPII